MPVTKNIDMKLQFEPYDCTPGPAARTFLRKCLQHGAKTDDQGWSLQDTFLRQDDGAVQNGTGIGIPGAANHVAGVQAPQAGLIVAPVGGGAAAIAAHNAQLNARKKRLKDSAAFILMHLDDESTTLLLEDSQGACRFSQNGPEIYDYIAQHCVTPYSTTELREMKAALIQVSILHTVGITQNSVKDLLKEIKVQNSMLGAAALTTDEVAETILDAIAKASDHLNESASKELNAPAGPIGAQGVREFQLAVPGGVIRDLLGMVNAFHNKWVAGFKGKQIHP